MFQTSTFLDFSADLSLIRSYSANFVYLKKIFGKVKSKNIGNSEPEGGIFRA